ncbi:MAG TPA: methyltransferase domain-containing protein [Acidimicrobiales bacterium]|nr:methyltransferase domain-containing protein [Acidimicrobiales bacterium]
MPNVEQAEYWDGTGGEHWVADAERYDEINRRYGERIVSTLTPEPGERVLDVGCGNGALCLAIAPRVAPNGSVRGLDLSGPMLANARRRAERAGLDNVELEKGDAQVAPLPDASFDAAVSRFGVMFFEDPVAAFANVGRALRPGGRLVFACWQELLRNEWIVVPAGAALTYVPMPELGGPDGPGPFSLADPDRVRAVLEEAGFADIALEDAVEPMRFGADAEEALAFMRGTDMASTLFENVDDATAAKAWDAIREALLPYETPDGLVMHGAAWLVTARRP